MENDMPITHMIPARWETIDGRYQKVSEDQPETFAHGKVLEVGTRSCRIMSDVWGSEKYAIYWDDVTQSPKHCSLDIADGSYQYGNKVHAEVDATEEVYIALRKYLFQTQYEIVYNKAKEDADKIIKNSLVEIYKGRSGKGTKGKVVVELLRPYNMGWRSSNATKYGIAIDDEKVKVVARNGKVYDNYKNVVWAWAHNCRLLNVPSVNVEQVKEIANGLAETLLETWRQKAQYNGRRVTV